MLRVLSILMLLSVPATAQELVFTIDLGSDNGQDPDSGGPERGFDPGDIYGSTAPIPVPSSGADGDVWDDCRLPGEICPFGPRPFADPLDFAAIWGIPLCPDNTCFGQFLDLDGIQRTQGDVAGVLGGILTGVTLSGPILLSSFPAPEANLLRSSLTKITSTGADDALLLLSFDDDAARGWSGSISGGPGDSIPGDSATSMGRLYGSSRMRDEVLGATLSVVGTTATATQAVGLYGETDVHPDLSPNPSASRERFDDDVDGLGYGAKGVASFIFFSPDHEATDVFEWGSIYSMPGFTERVRAADNLGLADGVDVDAFELVLVDYGSGDEAVALLFSVDDDDPYTVVDESGGLDPGAIYVSFMDGTSSVFLSGVSHELEALFGVDWNSATELFVVDPETGAESSLGPVVYDGGIAADWVNSLASDASGVLYTVHDDKLIEIDPAAPASSSSVVTLSPSIGGTSQGMVFDSAGTLWLLDQTGQDLYAVPDLSTGTAVSYGSFISLGLFLTGLEYDGTSGLLIATDYRSDLHTIDVSAIPAVLTTYPTTSAVIDTYALAYDSTGTLYGSEDFLRTMAFSGSGSSYTNVGPFSSVIHMHGLAFVNTVVEGDDVDALAVAPLATTAVSYCAPGTSASGCTASLSVVGVPSASAPAGFIVTANGVEGAKDGLLFFGTNGRQMLPWGNGTSYQCVKPPVKRSGLLTGSGTAGSCDGLLTQDLNALWTAAPAKNPGAGAVVQAQCWYRDPLNTSNQSTSLTDAVEFAVGP